MPACYCMRGARVYVDIDRGCNAPDAMLRVQILLEVFAVIIRFHGLQL